MGKIEPPIGGACWEGFRWDDGMVRCEEVYGHSGNHVGTEDRLVWTPDGVVVGGTLVNHQPLCNDEHPDSELGPFVYGYDDDEELGSTTDAKLTEWMEQHRIDPNAVDTDDYGDPDAEYDEHWAFWTSWTRLAIAWGLVLIGALLLLSGYQHGIVHIVVTSVAVGAAGCVAKLVYDAVRFAVDERRGE